MKHSRIAILSSFIIVLACLSKIVVAQNDTTVVCNSEFFQNLEKVSDTKTILVTKSMKTMTAAAFLKEGKEGGFAEFGLSDLDNDGKKEFITSTFTGGAHCCDVIQVFRNIGPNKYQYVAKMYGGSVCVTPDNELLYDFNEQYGYFFTCYACAYEDSSDAGPIPIHSIAIKFSKGKLMVVPGDQELRSRITDNLSKLGELPYEKVDAELGQDDGRRKEFAMNLAVYYYSFGRNLISTKKLFDKYYKFPDAKKVWAQFAGQLTYMRKDNDF